MGHTAKHSLWVNTDWPVPLKLELRCISGYTPCFAKRCGQLHSAQGSAAVGTNGGDREKLRDTKFIDLLIRTSSLLLATA